MDIFMKVVYADKELYGEDGLHFAHDGDAGLSPQDIAKKYGVDWGMAQTMLGNRQ